MKLIYFTKPNFGDSLNPWMWPKFFPDFFDENDAEVFLGIGSIIGYSNFPATARKIIFGAAYVPEYQPLPDLSQNYDIRFVRGPRSASLMGIDPKLAISDPAILLNPLLKGRPRTQEVISFMPHWESVERGNWKEACTLAGINFIDPTGDVDYALGEVLRSKFVIAEAMHGAIVADALRVPWVPLVPVHHTNRNKWVDWYATLDLELPKHRLWPSGVGELRLSKLRKPLAKSPLMKPVQVAMTHMAAHRLSQISNFEPMMSNDNILNTRIDQIMEKVDELRRERG